jgi:hypothetical protein
MIRKWRAIVLLILAASPVTAPFQTFDVVDLETGSEDGVGCHGDY